jgi:hypothetical protein
LEDRFKIHAEEVDHFLDTYVGEAWGMESGLPRRSDFTRDAYNNIARLLDPAVLFGNLRARYGAELDAAQYFQGSDIPTTRRIARQFAHVYLAVQKEKASAGAPGAASEKPVGSPPDSNGV